MKPLLILPIIALAISLTGCQKVTVVKSTTEAMTLTEFEKPRHASITFVNANGKTFKISLGKKCPSWEKYVVIGKSYQIPVDHVEYSKDGVVIKKDTKADKSKIKRMFCDMF